MLDNFCNLARRLGIAAITNLGNYLGFPIINQGRTGSVYNFVVNKIQSKLAGWRANLFSRAGRMVLVKSAIASVAEYYMQCQALPVKICDQIDKLIRDFLWVQQKKKGGCTWFVGIR